MHIVELYNSVRCNACLHTTLFYPNLFTYTPNIYAQRVMPVQCIRSSALLFLNQYAMFVNLRFLFEDTAFKQLRTAFTVGSALVPRHFMSDQDHQGLFYKQRLTGFMAWINNYNHVSLQGAVTHPCRIINGDLTSQPLKLCHKWITTSHFSGYLFTYID